MGGHSSHGPGLGCAFYRTEGGHEPVRDWLRGLGKEVSKTIGSDILTVQWSWPVFFCIAVSRLVLLHGIVKKARTTPKADLGLARKRLREVVAP